MRTSVLLTFAFLLVACQAESPPPAPPGPPLTDAERVFALVEANHLALLDRMVGQYARGEAVVYRGTLAARGRDVLDEGPVLATLRVTQNLFAGDSGTATGPALTAVSMPQRKRFRLWQTASMPGSTHADLVAPFGSTFGVSGACRDCLLALGTTPETITFDLVATGTFFDRSPLAVEARGSLARVPAAALTYDDLYVANQADVALMNQLDTFVRAGNEMSRLTEQDLNEKVPRPAAAKYDTCTRTTRYHLTQWFSAEDFASYGVRDFAILSSQICCVNLANEGCHEPPRECF